MPDWFDAELPVYESPAWDLPGHDRRSVVECRVPVLLPCRRSQQVRGILQTRKSRLA